MSAAPPYAQFADVILDGAGGQPLFDQLAERFPAICRADAFFGIAIAWAIREADLVLAAAEIRSLEHELAALKRPEAA